MFCVLEVVRFNAAWGGVAVGDEAEPFAIVDDLIYRYTRDIKSSAIVLRFP
jgi:hypothetical protein